MNDILPPLASNIFGDSEIVEIGPVGKLDPPVIVGDRIVTGALSASSLNVAHSPQRHLRRASQPGHLHMGPDPCQQLLGAERFYEVIVRPLSQALNPRSLSVPGRKHNKWHP